jgi:hypothetical protein
MAEENQEWSYTLPDDGRVFPEHLISAFWNYLRQYENERLITRVDSEEQLANLVYPAFQASLSSEEGRQVRLRVVFNLKPKQFTVQFAEPAPYSAGQLVKLAPTINLSSRWLVAISDETSQSLIRIEGILDSDILPLDQIEQRMGYERFYPPNEGLRLAVLGAGWLRLSTIFATFELRDCCLRKRLLVGRIKHVSDWLRKVPSYLAIEDTATAAAVPAFVRRFLVNVLAKISEARHGGCLLVLTSHVELSSLPLKIKYRVDSSIAQMVVTDRSSVGFKVSLKGRLSGKDVSIGPIKIIYDDSSFADALMLDKGLAQTVDLVSSLAAVDGAVLLSHDLCIIGFGAEITVSEKPTTDEKINRPAAHPPTDFGMRHRSAIRFCQEVPHTLAFVVSQDGNIRLFHNIDGIVCQWEELSAEEG